MSGVVCWLPARALFVSALPNVVSIPSSAFAFVAGSRCNVSCNEASLSRGSQGCATLSVPQSHPSASICPSPGRLFRRLAHRAIGTGRSAQAQLARSSFPALGPEARDDLRRDAVRASAPPPAHYHVSAVDTGAATWWWELLTSLPRFSLPSQHPGEWHSTGRITSLRGATL
ncbi:hypothetical protein OH76DRAFT_218941 [Lentinus brumalis]|uniref:Secreted protein n=1 Tax=Lentinus brumalis TaxID=2498619 RepID=A0A371CM86_9APHY|nr:hypothetical protein OH76DRAFT_218941 [Polyporus brumalis]